jgi:diadenosine tetraphosphate (Ap4A) HIT family hydrolase
MPTSEPLPDEPFCEFCAEVRHRDVNNFFRVILPEGAYRRAVLYENGGAAVIPSVGALTPGHVLVVPIGHYHSFAQLPPASFKAAMHAANDALAALRETYAVDVVAFEHGPVDGATNSGACSDHAHLHLLPLPGGLMGNGPVDSLPWRQMSAESLFGAARAFTKDERGYVALWDRGAWHIAPGEQVVSQHLRRVIADKLGRSDQWDWSVFPNVEEVVRTIDDLEGSIGH